MKIAIGCDEAAYELKQSIKQHLEARGVSISDFGTHDGKPVPYPDVAFEVAQRVAEGVYPRAILLCGTGIGMAICANKVPGIRAALCSDPGQTAGARIWNHANVLCLSNRTLSDDMAKEILHAWFDTEPGERGAAGVALLRELEARHRR